MIKADLLYHFPTVKDIAVSRSLDNYYQKMWFLGVFLNIEPIVFPHGMSQPFVSDRRRTFLL